MSKSVGTNYSIDESEAELISDSPIIRPKVFGASSKFGSLDSGESLQKIDGRWKVSDGNTVTLKASAYWHLIQAVLRLLPMNQRDRFILEGHAKGKSWEAINRDLLQTGIYTPYKSARGVEKRVVAIIRNFYLTPQAVLKQTALMGESSDFRVHGIESLAKKILKNHFAGYISLRKYNRRIHVLVAQNQRSDISIAQEVVGNYLEDFHSGNSNT